MKEGVICWFWAFLSHILKNAAVPTNVDRSHDRMDVQKYFQLEGFNIFSIYRKNDNEYRKATDIFLSWYYRLMLAISVLAFMLSDMCRYEFFFP